MAKAAYLVRVAFSHTGFVDDELSRRRALRLGQLFALKVRVVREAVSAPCSRESMVLFFL